MKTSNTARPVLCVGLTPAIQETRVFTSLVMGEVNRGLSVSHSPAGKGTNVARVLKTLGHEPVLIGFVGGTTGAQYRGYLTELGIRTAFVNTKDRTRVCVTLIERDAPRTTELVEEAALPNPAEWQSFHRSYRRLLPQAGFVTLTGALMPGAPATLYRDLAGLAAARQVPVIIDSQKAPLLEALPHGPILAKLNVHELGNTLATSLTTPAAIVAGARELLARGARNVLVTHGEHGAWLITADQAWHYPSPRVKVANPIGSGDAVTAGIASGLGRGSSLADAVRLGVACGTANALTPTPGQINPADVKRLLPKIRPRKH